MRDGEPDDRLALARTFLAVADRLSFARAAGVLGLPASTVSRRVARLEAALGVRLLQRTSRRVALTEAGRLYQERAEAGLALLVEAEDAARSLQDEPSGTLRLHLPVTFGRLHVSPLLPGLLARYPRLALEASFTDRYADLVAEGVDLALRIGGDLPPSELVARRLASIERVLCAAPAYLARTGVPATPAELGRHQCLNFTPYRGGDLWRLEGGRGECAEVRVHGRLAADNGAALLDGAVAGCGIALLATFVIDDALRRGVLVRVLPGWRAAGEVGLYAVYAGRRHVPAKVRATIDYLAGHFAPVPPWEA